MRTAECPRACEGSGDPPFLLACSLPPFSQSSPFFPPGNGWGGQVTRANAFPEEPWRDQNRDSGEFLAGQDPGAVHCRQKESALYSDLSGGPQWVTGPVCCPVGTCPHCVNRSLSSGSSRVQGSLSGCPGIHEDPEPGPRFPNSLRSQSWFFASSSSSSPHLGLGSQVSSFPQSVKETCLEELRTHICFVADMTVNISVRL